MRFIKLKEVMELTGLSRSGIYSKIKCGQFPSQIKIGERSVVWVEDDIIEWMESFIK